MVGIVSKRCRSVSGRVSRLFVSEVWIKTDGLAGRRRARVSVLTARVLNGMDSTILHEAHVQAYLMNTTTSCLNAISGLVCVLRSKRGARTVAHKFTNRHNGSADAPHRCRMPAACQPHASHNHASLFTATSISTHYMYLHSRLALTGGRQSSPPNCPGRWGEGWRAADWLGDGRRGKTRRRKELQLFAAVPPPAQGPLPLKRFVAIQLPTRPLHVAVENILSSPSPGSNDLNLRSAARDLMIFSLLLWGAARLPPRRLPLVAGYQVRCLYLSALHHCV